MYFISQRIILVSKQQQQHIPPKIWGQLLNVSYVKDFLFFFLFNLTLCLHIFFGLYSVYSGPLNTKYTRNCCDRKLEIWLILHHLFLFLLYWLCTTNKRKAESVDLLLVLGVLKLKKNSDVLPIIVAGFFKNEESAKNFNYK